MLLLDKMILSHRLTEFIGEAVRIRNDELNDKTKWEFFLHKVFDKTYGEFVKSLKSDNDDGQETMSEEELLATIRESQNITNNFCFSQIPVK